MKTRQSLVEWKSAGTPGSALALLLVGASACGGRAASEPPPDGLSGDFVSVRKALSAGGAHGAPGASAPAPSVAGLPSSDSDFYVAIRKSLLGTRWFLSAFTKQFHPDNTPLLSSLGITDTDHLLSDWPLGTRVVSFKVQNDRLFMFDASDRFQETPLQDPSLVLEAYPLVDSSDFAGLPGSEDYVLFDPSQGLNAFQMTGQLYADPYLEFETPLQIGLSFMQNFRTLPDGAAFEQVFSGTFDTGEAVGTIESWGTLGVALRRYTEGSQYAQTPDPGTPFYFTNVRFSPDGAGATEAQQTRWDFHAGRDPVDIYVSAGAQRAQDAFPNVDILGAIQRGIESWNGAFGFPVYHAVFTQDDEIRDDGSSFVLVDYPGPDRTSFGPVQLNPNTGEILSASVYLADGTFTELTRLGLGPASAAATDTTSSAKSGAAKSGPQLRLGLTWSGMAASPSECDRPTLPRELSASALDPTGIKATPEEQGAAWVQDFVVHEIGHTLGLRHNFKGSLLAPGGSSVMDYQTLRDSVALPVPGSYDVDAIRYLYQLSSPPPAEPFCTDEDRALDPTCAPYDQNESPLPQFWGPDYTAELAQVLDQGGSADDTGLADLNAVLAFARDTVPDGFVSSTDHVRAFQLALGRSAVPLSSADAAEPSVVAQANLVAAFVLRRAVLDTSDARGDLPADITDPAVLELLIDQAGQMLENTDQQRTYTLRRTAVDVLAALQSDAALVRLTRARPSIASAGAAAPAGSDDATLTADLLARVDAALNPYFK
jgi:hypothetical protein